MCRKKIIRCIQSRCSFGLKSWLVYILAEIKFGLCQLKRIAYVSVLVKAKVPYVFATLEENVAISFVNVTSKSDTLNYFLSERKKII